MSQPKKDGKKVKKEYHLANHTHHWSCPALERCPSHDSFRLPRTLVLRPSPRRLARTSAGRCARWTSGSSTMSTSTTRPSSTKSQTTFRLLFHPHPQPSVVSWQLPHEPSPRPLCRDEPQGHVVQGRPARVSPVYAQGRRARTLTRSKRSSAPPRRTRSPPVRPFSRSSLRTTCATRSSPSSPSSPPS